MGEAGAGAGKVPGKVQYPQHVVAVPGPGSKLGLCSATGAAMVLACVGCEIGKQVSNYSINYYNGGQYPLPQTLLVREHIPEHFQHFSMQQCYEIIHRWCC